jgi:pilus assembly protein Flp/PilA
MVRFYVTLHNFLHQPLLRRDDRGVTSVEYGLLVALIAIAIVGTVGAFTGALKSVFQSIGGSINQPPPG